MRDGAVHIEIDGARVHVDAPAGWCDRGLLTALRPELLRACAPPLPPLAMWPASWSDAFDERVSIVLESIDDPTPEQLAHAEAVALADLRVAVWRGDVPPADSPAGDPLAVDGPAGERASVGAEVTP